MALPPMAGDFATMVQQFYAPKSMRGSRLGRGPDMASTMVQYGYSTPGTNINVSPNFSNIGNPAVMTEGLSIGDVSLGDWGSSGDTFEPDGGGGGAPSPSPTGGGTSGGSQTSGGGSAGSKAPVGTKLNVSGGIQEALKKAAQKGQSKDPRITRSELKSTLGEFDKPRAIRNAIDSGKLKIGGKAADFLNKQLKEVGAKKISNTRITTPEPNKNKPKNQPTSKAPILIPGLINKAGVPGGVNMKQQAQTKSNNDQAKRQQDEKNRQDQAKRQQDERNRQEKSKAEAKAKAQAKSSSSKKKK